ncbi:hypothetical protein L7F22_026939 [Adiantum nelumboides]|nr:hypothetical protein [Adiantum nelumboides]
MRISNGLIIRGITTWEAVTTNDIELEDNLMIVGERVSLDTEPANPQASRHEPMTIKPIVEEPKIADMTLMDLTKAIQESLKVNQVPQNTHMVPPSVVQHTIPMISTAKPMQQRPYPMNPKYAKIVQEKLKKLIECGFVYPIEHSECVSPIVIVPKKNGRVCVDLKKVNAATRRDHYPLPYSEHVLERVAGKEAYSFLDGYFGYNQITIALEDQAKTAFIIEFGVFAFRVMAFGLTNALATFQRLKNTTFKEYLRDFCEAFLDDLYIYSSWEEHLSCLQKVFEKCRLYCISLNPFKCQYWVKHGVILGHIVSKNGISTDESKIKVILKLPPPHNYKGVQRFMGHVGYYRRFILLFAEIARPLYKLLIEFKWTEECDQAYKVLKKALASAPILRAPTGMLFSMCISMHQTLLLGVF